MQSRVITINIRKYLVRQPRSKRSRKAVRYFRERIAHYTKTEPDNVKIDTGLNAMIIKHYSRRMTPIKANVSIDKGIANVSRYGTQPTKPADSKEAKSKDVKKEGKKEEKKEGKKETNAEPKQQKQKVEERRKEHGAKNPSERNRAEAANTTKQEPKG